MPVIFRLLCWLCNCILHCCFFRSVIPRLVAFSKIVLQNVFFVLGSGSGSESCRGFGAVSRPFLFLRAHFRFRSAKRSKDKKKYRYVRVKRVCAFGSWLCYFYSCCCLLSCEMKYFLRHERVSSSQRIRGRRACPLTWTLLLILASYRHIP